MSKLVFGPFRIVDRFNVATLTPIETKQLLVAGKNAWNKGTVGAIFTASEEEDMVWEVVTVTDEEGAPRFDAWVLGGQHGTLFDAGTATQSGVVMVEGSFVAEKKIVTAATCKALKSAYVLGRPPESTWMESYEAYWVAFRAKEKRL